MAYLRTYLLMAAFFTPLSFLPNSTLASDDISRTEPGDDDLVVITLVGDTGFNSNLSAVRADGVRKHGRFLTWDETTSKIAAHINGDINFANIETIVSDHSRLRARAKRFNFRSHPNAIRHLAKLGFNLFSLANNHAADYGTSGIRETLRHMRSMGELMTVQFAGLGLDRAQAVGPRRFTIKTHQIAFSSMGIGNGGLSWSRKGYGPQGGQLNIHEARDYGDVTDGLRDSGADYKILSMHYGTELALRPGPAQIKRWRQEFSQAKGIDLIIGHHSHVAAGVEMIDGRLIFYGLGNFLHHGTQNMGRFGLCRDFGLLARVYLTPEVQELGPLEPGPERTIINRPDPTESDHRRLKARAIEIVPLKDMHVQTRPMSPRDGAKRIAVINYLARGFDSPRVGAGAMGVRFTAQPDGSGLYCSKAAMSSEGARVNPRLAKLCAGFVPAEEPKGRLLRQIRSHCGARYVASARAGGRYKSRRKYRARKRRGKKQTSFWSFF